MLSNLKALLFLGILSFILAVSDVSLNDAQQFNQSLQQSLLIRYKHLEQAIYPPVGETHHIHLAFCVQGLYAPIQKWISMRENMIKKHHVTLFLLTFDKPFNTSLETNIVNVFAPDSTWTSGRNLLLRTVLQYEEKATVTFKYIVFADNDVLDRNCIRLQACRGMETADMSCCYDALTLLLTSPIEYAVVAFFGPWAISDDIGFAIFHTDCADANLNAFHRDSFEVLLPYFENMDARSWWHSQGFMFNVIAGCVPGFAVHANIFDESSSSGEHSSHYPRGRDEASETEIKTKVFDKFGLCMTPLECDKVFQQGDCTGHQLSYDDPIVFPGDTGHWKTTNRFKLCSSKLKARYDSFVKTGDLSLTDEVR